VFFWFGAKIGKRKKETVCGKKKKTYAPEAGGDRRKTNLEVC
jgi:hypothetical protein